VTNIKSQVDWREASALTPQFVEQWRELYYDSMSPNIYLSPDFVLPALRMCSSKEAWIVCVKSGLGLQALAVVENSKPSRRFPCASMKLFKSKHSMQTGLLLKKGIENLVLDNFVHTLLDRRPCLQFQDMFLSTEAARRIRESAARQNLSWYSDQEFERAALRTSMSTEEWRATVSKKKLKEIARNRRRLEEQGDFRWRLLMGREVTDASVEAFLRLENAGWKGEQGDSLLSNPEEAEFFRQVVSAHRNKSEVFFTEITLDDVVIASTANFVSGNHAFAFKVAWQPTFAKYSPGIINEVAFVEYVTTHDVSFHHVDSGASVNSYINALWPDRMPMFTGYLLRGPYMRGFAHALTGARRAKASVNSLLNRANR
jgi:CelD/BcsL family acetyltransferase involved in cellulose biosynthesis